MSYCEMLENRFDRFIKSKNLLGASHCVEKLFNVKPHISMEVATLCYKKGLSLVDAMDQCMTREFKEGKI